MLPTPESFNRRIETPGGDYFDGFLAVQGGKGSINWDPAAPTEDPAIPGSDPTTGTDATLAKLQNTYLARRTSPMRVDEFVGRPLPRDLNLNASRLVLLTLQLTNREGGSAGTSDVCEYYYERYAGVGVGSGPDPVLRIELLADGQLVAGSVHPQPTEPWWWNYERPPEPEGYATCFYQMPLETSRLARGAVLTLRIQVMVEGSPFKWGLAGDHRSTLRIPVFSEVEWLFRDPERGRRTVAGDPTQPDEAGALFLTPILGLALMRRRRPAPLLLALLVASSGCFGGGGGGPADTTGAGSLSYSIAPGNGTGRGNGSIVGVVHDDLHIPLTGVHVSLLGTSVFKRTDNNGRFQFPSLAPQEYTIRFDLDEYASVQEEVLVEPGATSLLEVTLVPLEYKDLGARRHDHDYWGDDTRSVLFEDALGFECAGAARQNCQPRSSFAIPMGAPGEFRTIRPGTERVEVTISWDPAAMGRQRVGLAVQANNDPSLSNATLFYPRESGKVYRVASTWEMTDRGHTPYSSWVFHIYGDPVDDNAFLDGSLGTDTVQSLNGQSFRVKVEIFKGSLPLEPAHPDLWGGLAQLPIVQGQPSSFYASILPYDSDTRPEPNYHDAERVVPFDTEWVQVNLTLSRATSPTWLPVFYYRPGGYQPGTNYDIRSSEYKKAAAPQVNGNKYSWRLTLAPGEGDSVYGVRSSWVFAFAPDNADNYWSDYWGHYYRENLQAQVSVTAHRAAPA